MLLAFCIYCAVGAVVALAAENTPCTSTDGCTGGYVNGICDVCNGYEQPPQGEYDIYEISNAGQLYWFAEHVNIRGNNKISGKLMADIDLENRTWYPIGVYKDAVDASGTVATVEFKGDFDGNYHTVSNFTATGNGSQGLLGYTSGDTRITNIGVINATVSGWNAGAILGFMGSVHDSFAVNCTVTADTASEENVNLVHAGVIAGTQNANVYGSFAYDCAVNASESWVNAATLSPVGGKNAYTCYYGRVTTNGNLRTSDGEVELTDQFASGELAYSLGKIWGQTLGEGGDPHPVYANGENTVYRGYLTCADTEYTYSNTEIPFSAYNLHVFTESSNGFCENCDAYEAPSYKISTEMLEISNAGQLFWFATVTDSFSGSDRAVLVADIDLENRPWTPIGSIYEDNAFSGVFDGQNHTITGLYVEGDRAELGLFGKVRAGTVKNLTVYGEVVVKSDVDFVGGIVGLACGVDGETELERNGAIIQNVTSYVNVTVGAHGVGMIGGFVGYANHQSLIENCSWYGTFDAGIYRVDSGAGGFIGKIQENTGEVTIRNCAAYGTIKTNYEKNSFNNTPTIYMGGFLSLSDTGAKTTLENCLFAGKFERGENLTDQ
ncbi:MAG: hypothetical protein IKA48_12770, partial [Fibrobacter sp.]|nr:hypothetical protein [Fibrobacter sp.]